MHYFSVIGSAMVKGDIRDDKFFIQFVCVSDSYYLYYILYIFLDLPFISKYFNILYILDICI